VQRIVNSDLHNAAVHSDVAMDMTSGSNVSEQADVCVYFRFVSSYQIKSSISNHVESVGSLQSALGSVIEW
jgi:hypothetical protein